MHATSRLRPGPADDQHRDQHQWVAAALVGLGSGDTGRAEHAARTGRHVLPDRTRIDVLEVYCATCRCEYGERAFLRPCTPVTARAC